jgi:methyl-accepting chemotaxis protein
MKFNPREFIQNNQQVFKNSVGNRLVAAIVVMALPIVLLTITVYQTQQEKVSQAIAEAEGLSYLRPVLGLMVSLSERRDITALQLSSYSSFQNLLEEQTARVDERVAAVAAAQNQYADNLGESNSWQQIESNWQALREDNLNFSEDRGLPEHNLLLAELFDHSSTVADVSGLSLDPGTESSRMIDFSVYKMPRFLDQLGLLRLRLTEVSERGSLTVEDNIELTGAKFVVNEQIAELKTTFDLSFEDGTAVRAQLEPTFLAFIESVERVIEDANIIEDDFLLGIETNTGEGYLLEVELEGRTEQVFENATKSIALGAEFLRAVEQNLKSHLQSRVDEAIATQNLYLGSAALALIVALLLAVFTIRSVTTPIAKLNAVALAVAKGDSDARSGLTSSDEIGELGRQVDLMIDTQVATAQQITEENDQLNESIISILQAASVLTTNDLTVKVPVAEDITGAISDALNTISNSTAEVLGEVVGIAELVAERANEVQGQASAVTSLSEEERKVVANAKQRLDSASTSMMKIAQTARLCNEAAGEAIGTTEQAQATVGDTIGGINLIRDTIRETEKRIKRLGERSQEVGGVVSLINNIAERTHILALNASMHAASAGEAGRGFAVVANEVQRLAENSREATADISSLVNNIQVETADTVVTMNEVISRVVSGTALAEQAGNEMKETQQTTAKLVSLVEQIANDSLNQAKLSKVLREDHDAIEDSSTQTYKNLEAQMGNTKSLVSLSTNLLASVGVFTLPRKVSNVTPIDSAVDVGLQSAELGA